MAAKHSNRTEGDAPSVDDSKVRDILEYRSGLDDTLPPTPLKQLLAAGGANVYVLSTDAELCDTVQRAGGEQYPVFTVATWQELLAAIDSGRCGIALVDAALLGPKLDKRIAELERYASRVVTLVAADRAAAQELIGYLSARRIHRLLIKPPALGITRLLLESAVSRCIQLREQPGSAALETRTDRPRRARKTRGATGGRVPAWVLATALVSLAVGVVVVAGLSQWWRPGAAPAAVATAVAPPTTAAAPEPIVAAAPDPVATLEPPAADADRFADLLTRAERAFNDGRLAAPLGDNALDYYRTILAADPEHGVARERLEGVLDALFEQAERALLASSLDEAEGALASVRRATSDSSRLQFLEAQLERARAAQADAAAAAAAAERERDTAQQLAITVQPREPEPPPQQTPQAAETSAQAAPAVAAAAEPAPPSELDSLLTIAGARLARGQLLEPAGDSAFAYLERAAQINGRDPRVAAARRELGGAIANAALAAAQRGELEQAESLAAAAFGLGLAPQALAEADAAIGALREARARERHAALAAMVRARLASDALLLPDGDSALDHLTTLQDEGARIPELPALWSAFTGALATKTRDAIARRDWSAAQSWLTALTRTGRDVGTAETLARQVETARLQDEYLANAAPASELALLSYPAVEYPRDALSRGIEGWVDVEFTVDRTGAVQDAVIVEAEPAGRFDAAALAAVAQYRYAPFTRDGQTYARRVHLRIRFTLE